MTNSNDSKMKWEWNLPLLSGTIVVGVLISFSLYFVSKHQLQQVAIGLSKHARDAEILGDSQEEVKWLTRLVALDAKHVMAQFRLAKAVNTLATVAQSREEMEEARRLLIRCIGELDPVQDSERLNELRRLLIQRLIDLGSAWAGEAERQVLFLNANPQDRDALRWFALSLYMQFKSGEWRTRNTQEFERETHFWQWLSVQPVGVVLKIAQAENTGQFNSIQLTIALADAYISGKDFFGKTDEAVSQADLRRKAMTLVEQLASHQTERAQWSAFTLAQRLDSEFAKRLLFEIAPHALSRLRLSSPQSTSGPSLIRDSSGWDVQLVLSYANQLVLEEKVDLANSCFDELMGLDEKWVPSSILESLYLNAGDLFWNQGNSKKALDIWKDGCNRIGRKSGLGLWDIYATRMCEVGTFDEANRSLADLHEAIQSVSISLSSLQGNSNNTSSQTVRIIKWHYDILHAGLDLRFGKNKEAIVVFKKAFATLLPIPTPYLIQTNRLLARAYAAIELWDLAAQTLEEASVMTPEDKGLRKEIADAWRKAGITSRNLKQLQLADDGSFDFALSLLQSTLSKQRMEPFSVGDGEKAKKLFMNAEARLTQEKEQGSFPPREWLLELIRISLATDSEGQAKRISSDARNEKLLSLIESNPRVAELQAFGAVAFGVSENKEGVATSMRNLELLKDENLRLWFETNVKIAMIEKDFGKATELVNRALQDSRLTKKDVLDTAFEALETFGKTLETCNFMRLHCDLLGEESLFRLGVLLLDFEQETTRDLNNVSSLKLSWSPTAELNQVIQKLMDSEGGSGTRWRLLQANRLFRKFIGSRNRDDLIESQRLVAEISAIRPDWSLALTLRGQIAAEQGNSSKAADSFRTAISMGDQRVSTVLQLVTQLKMLGRTEEAEAEFERIASLSEQFATVSKYAIKIASDNGRYDQALKSARRGTEIWKNDASAWLLLSQAAQFKADREPDDAKELTLEAQRALEQATRVSDGRDSNLWLTKLRFEIKLNRIDQVMQTLEQLNASSLPEKAKALISTSTYFELHDYKKAKTRIDQAMASSPNDIDLKLKLVDYYRLNGDRQALLKTLEELHQREPKREDIRRSLALALAIGQTDGPLPWARIASLLEDVENSESDTTRFYYAMLLATRGGESQMEKSGHILRELGKSKFGELADNAIRLSIAIEQRRWSQSTENSDTSQSGERLVEIRKLFDSLTKRKFPAGADLFQYADFLIRAASTSEVPSLIDSLQRVVPGSSEVLSLQIRLAKAHQEMDIVPSLVDNWVQSKNDGDASRLSKAGNLLSSLGFERVAVELLQRAYAKDPREFRSFVDALARSGELSRAVELCIRVFEKDNSSEAISQLADIAHRMPESLAERIEDVLAQGLDLFPSDANVLESIGTLRLLQQNYPEAFQYLLRAEKLVPESLLTLNNLALAASEIPGKESEGLPRIYRAIELFGRLPDLLDTLGTVQMRCGLLENAETNLRESLERRDDPRFGLHLIEVLLARKDKKAVQRLLESLKIEQLEGASLSPRERQILVQMTNQALHNAE